MGSFTPSAATPTATHTIPVTLNGATYKILLSEHHDENDTLRGGPASLRLNAAVQYPAAEPGDLCVGDFGYS